MMKYDERAEWAIGIDIGGTKINVGLISKDGDIAHCLQLPTLVGEEEVLGRVHLGIEQLVTSWKESRNSVDGEPYQSPVGELAVRGIGIGTAGQVNVHTGSILYASSLMPGYTGTPLRGVLEHQYRLPVTVDNDVHTLALAEYAFGAGKGARQLVCIALGTGVGGALITEGQLVHGVWGAASELGHLSVAYEGRACICGGRGCLEQYASGNSIARLMNERLPNPGDHASAREVLDRWRQGDPVAQSVMDDVLEALAAGIASIIHMLNPDVIVIGGGVSEAGEELLHPLRQKVKARTMPSMHKGIRIERAHMGNDSGMIGAVLPLWQADVT